MDGGAWWAAVHGVTNSQTQLSDFPFTSHFHALEEEMATHSSVPAWRIPGMGEPGGLPSVRSHRVGLKRLSSSSSSGLSRSQPGSFFVVGCAGSLLQSSGFSLKWCLLLWIWGAQAK